MGRVDVGRVGVAGVAASLAYLVEMAVDMRLLRYPQSDLMLQGRMLPVFGSLWPLVGLVMHVGFGVTLALIYHLWVRERLAGPGWLRGVIFASLENALLWPLLVPLVDRYHPAVRDGSMPPLGTARCFGQAVLRHVAYGAVLGAIDAAGWGRRRAR